MSLTPAQLADLEAWNRLARFEPREEILAYRAWFAVSMGAAELLRVFKVLANQWLSTDELGELTRLSPGTVRVYVSHLRSAMESESIDTLEGRYMLTDVGLADCKRALEDRRSAA